MQLFLGLSRGSSTRLDSSSHSLSFFFVLRQKRFHFFLRFRHIFFLSYYLFWPWSEVWSAAMAVNSVHWFRKCLRLHDNPALQEAVNAAHTLRCVYILDPWFAGAANVGINRWRYVSFSPAGCDSSLTLTFAVNTDCLRGLKACAGVQGPGLCYTTVSRC